MSWEWLFEVLEVKVRELSMVRQRVKTLTVVEGHHSPWSLVLYFLQQSIVLEDSVVLPGFQTVGNGLCSDPGCCQGNHYGIHEPFALSLSHNADALGLPRTKFPP